MSDGYNFDAIYQHDQYMRSKILAMPAGNCLKNKGIVNCQIQNCIAQYFRKKLKCNTNFGYENLVGPEMSNCNSLEKYVRHTQECTHRPTYNIQLHFMTRSTM